MLSRIVVVSLDLDLRSRRLLLLLETQGKLTCKQKEAFVLVARVRPIFLFVVYFRQYDCFTARSSD